MQARLSQADQLFQEEVRDFISTHLDPQISRKVKLGYYAGKAETDAWTRTLNQRGWAAPNWPVEAGGTGWSMIRRHVFEVEMRAAHAPELQGFGFNMVGPAIIKYGSPEQQAHYLPKILNADISWCQGYSEPQSGSDLASVSTRAVSDGDSYLVTGSKIWTSAAENADHIFALVRTDPAVKPQLGISFILMAMNSPGITVEPLLAFNGKRLWNQVFFDNVRVPKGNRLGAENQGWTVAKTLLGNERLHVSRVAENRRKLGCIIDIARAEQARGIELGFTPGASGGDDFSLKLASLEIRLAALDATAQRLLSIFDMGGTIGAEPSMLKLKGSELVQAMDNLLYEAIGYYGLPEDSTLRGAGAEPVGPDYADMVASGLFHHRGYTIAGGTSEVQHNIIAQAVLRL